MSCSVSEGIRKYLVEHPLASAREIRLAVGGTRQLVSSVMRQFLSPEEINCRKSTIQSELIKTVRSLLMQGRSRRDVCRLAGVSARKLQDIIQSDCELVDFFSFSKHLEVERINNISSDWINGMSLSDIGKNHMGGVSSSTAASYISRYRSRYGVEMFPVRLNNNGSVQSKRAEYNSLKSSGMSNVAISRTLGYSSVYSMRSALFNARVRTVNTDSKPTNQLESHETC